MIYQNPRLNKTPFKIAQENGFLGTEEEFNSDLVNITEIDDIAEAQSSLQEYINGLSAEDIGARPDTWVPSASDVGVDPSGTAVNVMNEHNTNSIAHEDIRQAIASVQSAAGAASLLTRFNEGLGNEYMWERVTEEFVITTDAESSVVLYYNNGDAAATGIVWYADEISDSKTLVNPKSLSVSYNTYTAADLLKGKYFTIDQQGNSTVYYGTQDSTTRRIDSGWYNVDKIAKAVISANKVQTVVDYVNSSNSDAFPPAASDGFIYNPMGTIGSIESNSLKLDYIEYVGTGVKGSEDNPAMSWTLKGAPVLAWFCDRSSSGNDIWWSNAIPVFAYAFTGETSKYTSVATATNRYTIYLRYFPGTNEVKWYDSYGTQVNGTSFTYRFYYVYK